MNNAMQLKAAVKKVAQQKKISPQLAMQNYMLERFLERMSVSKYRKNFIIKGGFLIAALVGLDARTTMDMDATIKGLPVNEASVKEMIENICREDLGDDITFIFRSIGEIREGDEYTGYRVALSADYPPISVPIKLDITTGDKITPKEVETTYRLLFEDRSITVLTYNVETILAEKLETVISRGELNTRPRDFYDIYIIEKTKADEIDMTALKSALAATSKKRNSSAIMEQYNEILENVSESGVMNSRWNDYAARFEYVSGISFKEVCTAARKLIDGILAV